MPVDMYGASSHHLHHHQHAPPHLPPPLYSSGAPPHLVAGPKLVFRPLSSSSSSSTASTTTLRFTTNTTPIALPRPVSPRRTAGLSILSHHHAPHGYPQDAHHHHHQSPPAAFLQLHSPSGPAPVYTPTSPSAATEATFSRPSGGGGDEDWKEVCELLLDCTVPSPRQHQQPDITTFPPQSAWDGGPFTACPPSDMMIIPSSSSSYLPAAATPKPEGAAILQAPRASPAGPGCGSLESNGEMGGPVAAAPQPATALCPSPNSAFTHSKVQLKCTISQAVVRGSAGAPPSSHPAAAASICITPSPSPTTTTTAQPSLSPRSSSSSYLSSACSPMAPPDTTAAPPSPGPSTASPTSGSSSSSSGGGDGMSSFDLTSAIVAKVAVGVISHTKARALLTSWHCWNLLLAQDTTCGLLLPLARTFRLPLPSRLPPASLAYHEAERAERAMLERLDPLWALDSKQAVCSVRWCRGQVRVTCSERFDAVFMSKTLIEEGIMARALLPHLLWARLVTASSQAAFWDAWIEASFEDKGGMASRQLRVLDRFGLECVMNGTMGVYASPCGWYSCTWLVLQ